MKRILCLLAALAVLVLSGLVHGVWTERWQRSEALERMLPRLELVPMVLGDWQGTPQEAEAEAFHQAGAQGYWVRQYTHRHKKTSLTVILMCGRAGRMSVHTPEVCFRGAGYVLAEGPTVYPVGGDGALWSGKFSKGSNSLNDLNLYWGWNSSGTWEAPASPRWKFSGLPYLFKLYVIRESPALAEADPMPEFFAQLMPALDKALFTEK